MIQIGTTQIDLSDPLALAAVIGGVAFWCCWS